MGDWGGDYSMILHNVEDKLEHHLSDENSSNRKRIRADSLSMIDQDSEASFNHSMTSSSLLRLNLQLDEVKIKNEELAEKIKSQRDDFLREREKYARQLEFMENDCKELKEELEIKKEKYYAVKKKLQATIRAADSEKHALTQQILQLSQAATATTAVKTPVSSPSNWEDRLNQLESSVAAKNAEAKRLAIANADLEEKCAVLEHRLLAARAETSSSDSHTSTRSLQKQVGDLESLLRRRSREVEKLEHQLKNQHLLEQDLSSANQKLLNLRAASKSLQETEAKYNALLKERESWTTYFADIVGQLDSGSGDNGTQMDEGGTPSSREVTPVLVLRLLSRVQSQCASLLRSQCEADMSNSTLRSQLRQVESSLKEAVTRRELAEENSERATKSLVLLQQQVKLYEGEVMSLRALLKTFDAEVAILEGHNRSSRRNLSTGSSSDVAAEVSVAGASGAEALLRTKDALIQELREEVDSLRSQRQKDLECMAEAQTARVKAEDELRLAQRAETHGGEEQVAWQLEKRQLKLKCEDLFGELLSLQKATGLDFIPGKTKVLHVKHSANPSLLRYGSSDDAVQTQPDASDMIVAHSTFITPMDELRHLRKEVKALRHLQSTSAPSQSTLLDTSISLCNTSSAMTTTASTGGVDSNKMNARLKEMFRERINSYREAVYLLFGYKVELYSADVAGGGSPYPQLKLRSMYAESPDDSLVFQMKGDILELMETPFATGLDESLLHTLQTSNAVPVFLANVSLDLFEKQTFMG